jgi:hypothetical protein
VFYKRQEINLNYSCYLNPDRDEDQQKITSGAFLAKRGRILP